MGSKVTALFLALAFLALPPVQAQAAAPLLRASSQTVSSLEPSGTASDDSAGTSSAVLLSDNGRIEQIFVNMPDVFVYGSGFGKEEAAAGRAFIGQTELALDPGCPELWADQGEGLCWYVLLDVSGSIPDAYFRAVKEGILNLQDALGADDSLILITFGSQVKLLADGSQTPEELAQILSEVDNADQQTLLFEAVDRAAALSAAVRDDQHKRCLIAVITDGEDIAAGRTQAQEALDTLAECAAPVYAFCISATSRQNMNSFSEFARNSGGAARVFLPAEGNTILTDLQQEADNSTVLHYRASGNLVSNASELFSLHLTDGRVFSRAVMMNRWQADTESPQLLSADAISPTRLSLVFSEPLQGADNAANYRLYSEDEDSLGIRSVSYRGGEEPVVELMLTDAVENGNYFLVVSGITDVSMEKNPIEGNSETAAAADAGQSVLQFAISGLSAAENAGNEGASEAALAETEEEAGARGNKKSAGSRAADMLTAYWWILIPVPAGLGILLAVMMLLKKRKAKAEADKAAAGHRQEPDPSQVCQKYSMPGQPVKQHLAADIPVIEISAQISRDGMRTVSMTWQLEKSLIIGRSSICDICMDDRQLSRQHFCLEAENGQVLISDLHSSNGTSVNGIRIAQKRRLESGSLVEAGSLKIKLSWNPPEH